MHAVWNHRHSLGGEQMMPHNRIACRSTHGYHVGSLLQPIEDASGHGAKPAGARFAFGIEETAKSIQVVAGDHGPSGRKIVHQLRITMVDYMEQIKLRNLISKPAGIVKESI